MRLITTKIVATLSLSLALTACSGTNIPDTTPVTGVAYVGATVSDLDQTTDLYTRSADVKDVRSLEFSGEAAFNKLAGREVDLSTRMLRSVNAQVRYMHFADTSDYAKSFSAVPVQGPGIAHLCFQVNSETGTYEKFLEHGATHIGARDMQVVNPRNPVEYAYINDQDGLVVEVEHVDVEKLNLETPPKNNYRIRHISLATPDMDRIVKFYSHFLGEKKPRKVGRFGGIGGEALDGVSGLPGAKVKMSWFQTRNLELEIIQYVTHPTESPTPPRPIDAIGYNMIVFDVTDLTKAKEQFVAAGGTMVSESENLDGGQILFGRDPDGNLIGMQIPADGSEVSSAQFKNNGI